MSAWRCVAVMVAIAAIAPSSGTSAGAAADQSITDQLADIRKTARDDVEGAAQALRALRQADMTPEDRATWVRLSRETAVRSGDRATLLALRKEPDPFARLPEARIILAHAFVDQGEFASARAELAKIVDLAHVNSRDQRRFWALKAKMARLEADADEERRSIEQIVHELGKWPSKDCQSCHGDPKHPEITPLLDVQAPWFATRYVDLMKHRGDARKVKADAEQRLAGAPDDPVAIIELGFSLLAQGDRGGAEAVFGRLSWLKLPARAGAAPRAIFAWP